MNPDTPETAFYLALAALVWTVIRIVKLIREITKRRSIMFDWRMDASPYARKVLLSRVDRGPRPNADLSLCPKCGKYFTPLLQDANGVDVAGWRCFDHSHWRAAGLIYPPESKWQYTRQRIHFEGEDY